MARQLKSIYTAIPEIRRARTPLVQTFHVNTLLKQSRRTCMVGCGNALTEVKNVNILMPYPPVMYCREIRKKLLKSKMTMKMN